MSYDGRFLRRFIDRASLQFQEGGPNLNAGYADADFRNPGHRLVYDAHGQPVGLKFHVSDSYSQGRRKHFPGSERLPETLLRLNERGIISMDRQTAVDLEYIRLQHSKAA